jgi:hypothetical protein
MARTGSIFRAGCAETWRMAVEINGWDVNGSEDPEFVTITLYSKDNKQVENHKIVKRIAARLGRRIVEATETERVVLDDSGTDTWKV